MNNTNDNQSTVPTQNTDTNAKNPITAAPNQTAPASLPSFASFKSLPSFSPAPPHASDSLRNPQELDSQPPPAAYPSPLATPQKTPVVPPVPRNFSACSAFHSAERIANLPLGDLQTIDDWLDAGFHYRDIIQMAAQPRPEGLNLKLSLGSLCRYFQKRNLADKIQRAAELVQTLCPENARDTDAALKILAQSHAVETLGGPNIDNAAFQQITRFLLRQEDQRIRHRSLDLHQKRLAYHMQHTHYDITKRTIEKLADINEIVRNESLTFEERYREMRIKLFGRESVEMIERANKKFAEQHPELQNTEPDIEENDLIPPMTPEQQQAADAEAIDVMMGWKKGQPDAGDQTHPL